MALSFPYPSTGGPVREPGNGCIASCVHRAYCPAYWWLARFQNRQDVQDAHLGLNCASWSDNPADRVIGNNPDDVEQNNRLNGIINGPVPSEPARIMEMMAVNGILVETDTGGIVEPVTGGRWRDEA